jgi:DNA-binding transcriptional MocR family regulator
LVSWQEPQGGYLIWLKLKIVPEQPLDDHFESFGVRVSLGKNYFYTKNDELYLRLSISALDQDHIEEGIKKLGMAIDNLAEK